MREDNARKLREDEKDKVEDEGKHKRKPLPTNGLSKTEKISL